MSKQEDVTTPTQSEAVTFLEVKVPEANRSIFPDGIKTSGQHAPIEQHLRGFEEFPKVISGRTAWKAEKLSANPQKWIHHLTHEELTELGLASDRFLQSGEKLTSINKQMCPILETWREECIDGKGFVLFKGLPVGSWGRIKAAVAFMGLSCYFGNLITMNAEGLLLGHITDQGHDPNQLENVKISRTNAPQLFHTDECDIVGLLCLAKAKEGGLSTVVSAHTVWNALIQRNIEAAKTLAAPIWYVDRKGEQSAGEKEWIKTPVFLLERGTKGRVYVKWDKSFVTTLARFSDKGILPSLSSAQISAMNVLEKTCQELALHMELEVGDIQMCSCVSVLHARSGFIDQAPPAPPRHLFRTWIATQESEGGWKLPYHDSNHPKRGGNQKDDTAPIAEPLIVA
ncbi:MAG: hypothetical protein Q9165_002139 [Trypethelium subeluteriae]